MSKKKPPITYNTKVPKTCGIKYVSRRINGVPMYSICNKKKGHWFGGHHNAK